MTEEQVREIVRDEIQEEALKVGGVYDHCREVSFAICRGSIEVALKRALGMYESKPKRGGEAQSESA